MNGLVRKIAAVRLIRFVVVGIGAALLFFIMSWALLSAGLPPFAGSVIAYVLAFVVAYSAQRGWTFEGQHHHGHALPRYLVAQLACAVFAGLCAHVAVSMFSAPPIVMSAVATLAAGAASYVLSSVWVFRDDQRAA
ncbi:GtrA family protein [Mesorhizobium sp. BR1-1-9]|uniref:GtrA family protein n=1 Tax=unclassified Mesorhizobium TaxID=325217 RepID=UPI00112C33F3|nr:MULTISPECIES: GtrA family protein [unclassified Mesorhizobium]MBZ9806958.1 GtrA family protein [Mesorhizobium sp. ESP-6-2]MBZ9871586.1 GtrA family protein [Mesorhizobium sp. BR1-1-9]MBZ9940177.1 GtrA family protein [Mesorhizobium sp. BR1-1-13]TPM30378.1 GtrA family protein [Mesorhizobium sp. B2-2-2]